MPERTPIKYEAGHHRPFAPGDTLPPPVLALLQRVRPGYGIDIVDNGDGTLTVVNTCCDTPPPNGSVHTLTMAPVLANILEGNDACWTITLNAPVADAPLPIAFALAGDEQSIHNYSAPTTTIAIGAQSAAVCVATTDDAVDEPARLLILQPVFGARLTGWTPPGNQSNVIQVLDNDGGGDTGYIIVSITPAAATIIEGQAACWYVELDRNVTDIPLTVSLAFSGDEQAQHNYPTPTLTIPVGTDVGPVCLITTDDAVIEADRTLTLTAFTDARISAVPGPSSITVRDNDSWIGLPETMGGADGGCCGSDASFPTYAIVFQPDGRVEEFGCAGEGGTIEIWSRNLTLPLSGYEVLIRNNTTLESGYGPANTWLSLDQVRIFEWMAGDGVGSPGGNHSRFARGTFDLRRTSTGEVLSSTRVMGPQLLYGNECP